MVNARSEECTRDTGHDLVLGWHLLETSSQTGQVGGTDGPECVPPVVLLSQVGHNTFRANSDGSECSESQGHSNLKSGSSPEIQPCIRTEGGVQTESQHLEGSLLGVDRFPFWICAGIAKVDKWVWPLVGGVGKGRKSFFGHSLYGFEALLVCMG